MKDSNTDAEYAIALGNEVLKDWDERGVHYNIAQTALGHSWIVLLKSIGWKKKDFREVCEEMGKILDD